MTTIHPDSYIMKWIKYERLTCKSVSAASMSSAVVLFSAPSSSSSYGCGTLACNPTCNYDMTITHVNVYVNFKTKNDV